MNEKIIQTLFNKKNETIGVFELKLCKEKRFNFKKLARHQELSLLAVEGDGLTYKISDMSADQKPFDCFRLANIPAYVVIVWYEPRKPKAAHYIRIEDFISLRERSAKKSCTEGEAILVSKKTIIL